MSPLLWGSGLILLWYGVGMAASKALSSGVSMYDICNAVGWFTTLTCVRFYSLGTTPASSVLSAYAVQFYTRQGLVSMVAWAVSLPKRLPT